MSPDRSSLKDGGRLSPDRSESKEAADDSDRVASRMSPADDSRPGRLEPEGQRHEPRSGVEAADRRRRTGHVCSRRDRPIPPAAGRPDRRAFFVGPVPRPGGPLGRPACRGCRCAAGCALRLTKLRAVPRYRRARQPGAPDGERQCRSGVHRADRRSPRTGGSGDQPRRPGRRDGRWRNRVLAVDSANADAEDLLAAPADRGEIRRLTILFADLVDSTVLSSRVEPGVPTA